MQLSYVATSGHVHRGHLTTDHAASSYGQPVLVPRGSGEALGPGEVLALLAPREPRQDEREILWQAIRAGYQVQDA